MFLSISWNMDVKMAENGSDGWVLKMQKSHSSRIAKNETKYDKGKIIF